VLAGSCVFAKIVKSKSRVFLKVEDTLVLGRGKFSKNKTYQFWGSIKKKN
jgi:hypothetical protein